MENTGSTWGASLSLVHSPCKETLSPKFLPSHQHSSESLSIMTGNRGSFSGRVEEIPDSNSRILTVKLISIYSSFKKYVFSGKINSFKISYIQILAWETPPRK